MDSVKNLIHVVCELNSISFLNNFDYLTDKII